MRKRLYKSNADRQRAYRERKLARYVIALRNNASPLQPEMDFLYESFQYFQFLPCEPKKRIEFLKRYLWLMDNLGGLRS